jgi:hypothetical protein
VKNLILLLILFPLFIQCNKSGSGIGSSEKCRFTLSEVSAGNYGSVIYTDQHSGFKWFNCSGIATSNDYPQVTVGIRTDVFNGAGTYYIDRTDGVVLVALSDNIRYRSANTSSNCEATFATATDFTFSCENIPRDCENHPSTGCNVAPDISVPSGTFSP